MIRVIRKSASPTGDALTDNCNTKARTAQTVNALEGTQVTHAGVNELRKALPNTWIVPELEPGGEPESVAEQCDDESATRPIVGVSLKVSQVTDAGVDELQRALPNCRIDRWRER